MVKQVVYKGDTYAIILYANFKSEGIVFFTPDNFPQQMGYMNRPKGYCVAAHKHRQIERKVFKSQEVLIVRSGSIKAIIYDNLEVLIEEVTLEKGDIILLADGGHSFEWLEEGELVEVKQGPYLFEKDKIMLTPLPTENEII